MVSNVEYHGGKKKKKSQSGQEIHGAWNRNFLETYRVREG